MATWSATRSLDPRAVAGTGNSGGAELAALYDTIMRYDPGTGEFEPQTAESLTPNADFTKWTLKLRSGISFTDGTPYDAAAVVAHLKAVVARRATTASLVTPITNYETPDPLTVIFTLSFAWNAFPFALSSAPGMVVSPTATEALGDSLGTNPAGAGAGPFVIDSFKPDESVTLKRNPDYWGGDVYLDELRFIFAGTGAQTYEAFKARTVQAAFLRDPSAERDAEEDGLTGYSAIYSSNDTLIMNNGLEVTCQGGQPAPRCDGQSDGTKFAIESPTSDRRVRRAVAAAIDLDTLNQRVYNGVAELSTDLIAPKSRWYAGVDGPTYDIDEARRLVDEVRGEGDWDGRIRVSCHTGLPTWGTAVKGMLEAAGFEVDLTDQQAVSANTATVVVQKDFDLACFGSSISDAEPFFALNRDFNSTFAGSNAGNFSGYINPAVDRAIVAGRAARSEADVKAAIRDIAEAYATDVPWLALSSQPEVILLSSDVKGVEANANTVLMFGSAFLS